VNSINEHLCQSMYLKCPPPACTHGFRCNAAGQSQCWWCPDQSQTKFAL